VRAAQEAEYGMGRLAGAPTTSMIVWLIKAVSGMVHPAYFPGNRKKSPEINKKVV